MPESYERRIESLPRVEAVSAQPSSRLRKNEEFSVRSDIVE